MKIAQTRIEIENCFAVMHELRPHLVVSEFIEIIKGLSKNYGYKLAYLEDGGEIVSVAGIRVGEWLYKGKYLEIEDLITKEGRRSEGFGGGLFDDIVCYARELNCDQVRLVSGVKRELAHKFYLEKGMEFEAKYFSINL